MSVSISTEELGRAAPTLRAGDRVLLSGTVYTARDAAHKRLCALLDQGEPLPFDLFAPRLLDLGLLAMIGSCESIKKMSVAEFPLTVAIDSQGSDLYQTGREIYRHG